jgi:hypothetical protein
LHPLKTNTFARRTLATSPGMGIGIRDGMVTIRPPDMRVRNWHELLVLDESFPMSSPLDLEVEWARRGELTAVELDQLNERMKAIEEVTKRYISTRTMGRGMPGGCLRCPGLRLSQGHQAGNRASRRLMISASASRNEDELCWEKG